MVLTKVLYNIQDNVDAMYDSFNICGNSLIYGGEWNYSSRGMDHTYIPCHLLQSPNNYMEVMRKVDKMSTNQGRQKVDCLLFYSARES